MWAAASSCELESTDRQALVSLFSAKPTKSIAAAGDKGPKSAKKKAAPTGLIDGKRANNMAIALAQVYP